MNLEKMAEKYRDAGYSERNADARVCQDIVLKAIARSNLGRNVTIKGGVVMRSITGNVRRATEDLDLDFIRYSLEDESIRYFISKLNCLEGFRIEIKGNKIEQLSQQEYSGKRVYIIIKDDEGNVIESKIDLGVHANMNIEQDTYCFDVCMDDEGASLLINSCEQIFAEKLRSLLRFGPLSTRYKDIFDFCCLRRREQRWVLIHPKSTAVSVKNEVMEMIVKVRERKGGLDLPIVSGKHLRKISDRTALQSADNAEKFITARKIDSFESLEKFTADKEQRYQQLETVHLSKGQKLNRLKELSKMYALYAPIQATYKESQLLKGLAKMRYDKEHKDSLSKYRELKERMQSLLQNGEKITPKQWKAEIQSLQSEYDSIGKEQTKTATELAYAEVISYNRKNIERELQNESRQRNRQQGKIKRREEEI